MKVDVITVEQVKIKWWRWWSNWIDVSVFNYDYTGYLLLMKVSRTNNKKFKVVPFKSAIMIARADTNGAGDLTQMARAQ